MVSISNKVTRLARMPQTLRVIRSIKALSEEVEGNAHKNILMATYNLVKVGMSHDYGSGAPPFQA